MGKRRGESSSILEIRVEGRRFREVVQASEGSRISRYVPFVRRFEEGDLNHACGKSRPPSANVCETRTPFLGKAPQRDPSQYRPRGPNPASLLASR